MQWKHCVLFCFLKGWSMTIGITNARNSIEGSGDKIFAVNNSGKGYAKGDKVLVDYRSNVLKDEEFIIEQTTNGRSYATPVWFDNDRFAIFTNDILTSYKYVYENGGWIRYRVNALSASQTYFKYIPDMGMFYDNRDSYEYPNNIIDENGSVTALSYTDGGCIGKFDEHVWAWKNSSSGGFLFDGTQLNTAAGIYVYCVDYELRRFLLRCVASGYESMQLFYITDDGTDRGKVVGNNSSILPSNTKCVGCTGLDVGDYVIMRPNIANNCASSSGSSVLGNADYKYLAYKVGETQPIVELESDDILKSFLDKKYTIWNMDQRHNCLIIGTKDNVYILEFDKETKKFREVASSFELPENPNGEFIYNASLSPDKRKLVVYVGDIYTSGQNLRIYDVNNDFGWTIVENTAVNYDRGTSFTGIYTGKNDNRGKLEVETALVDKIDVTVVANVELKDGEISIGGVSYE